MSRSDPHATSAWPITSEPGAIKGDAGPLYRAEFLNGDPRVEGGQRTRCNAVGSSPRGMKHYLLDSRATLDAA